MGQHNLCTSLCRQDEVSLHRRLPKRELYDMQLTDHEYRFEANGRPEIWNERVHDVSLLRNRFDDLATYLILAEAQSY